MAFLSKVMGQRKKRHTKKEIVTTFLCIIFLFLEFCFDDKSDFLIYKG